MSKYFFDFFFHVCKANISTNKSASYFFAISCDVWYAFFPLCCGRWLNGSGLFSLFKPFLET